MEENQGLKSNGDFPVNKIKISTSTTSPTANKHSNSHAQLSGRKSAASVVSGYKTDDTTSSAKKLWFRMSDVVVSITILLTISIGFWRGVWQLADHYCEVYEIDPWISFGVCNVILVGLYYFQETLQKHVHPNKMNFLIFYIITRLILIIHGLAFVNQWRGLWVAFDILFPYQIHSLAPILMFLIPISIAIPLKIFSNFLATPLYVGIDDAHSVHSCLLRFTTPPEKSCQYFLDCLFSVVVVQSLTIISWSGLWHLADIYIYPEDLLSSGIVCWIIGNFVVIILCAIQPFYYKRVTKLKGLCRLALINLVTVIGFVGCVLGWRGCWELFNTLLIFETPLTSEWVTTIFGGLGAMLLGCLSTVVNRGALTDGELSPDDTSSDWNVSYVSLLEQRDFTVPFPEPWILRYFCTSQKMNVSKRRNRARSANNIHVVEYGEALKPLTNQETSKNSIQRLNNAELC